MIYNHFLNAFPNLDVKKTPFQYNIHKDFTTFNKKSFKELCLEKLHCVANELQQGNIVLYIDLDVFICKNDILNYIEQALVQNDIDMIIQVDQQKKNTTIYCAGLFGIRPTYNAIQFMTSSHIHNYPQDQAYINDNIHKLAFHELPPEQFPSGFYWFNSRYTKKDVYAIHYNFIVGDTKKKRMKQDNNWIDDYYKLSQAVLHEKTCIITYGYRCNPIMKQYNADLYETSPDIEIIKKYDRIIIMKNNCDKYKPTIKSIENFSLDDEFISIKTQSLQFLQSLQPLQLSLEPEYKIQSINTSLFKIIEEKMTIQPTKILVHSKSGLGNRLRVLFTILEKYKNWTSRPFHIYYVWNITEECNGSFDEIFEIHSNYKNILTITNSNNLPDDIYEAYNWLLQNGSLHEFHTYRGITCISTFYPVENNITQYSINSITFNHNVRNKVNSIKKALLNKEYIAVHIRRTDIVKDKKGKLENENTYVSWLQQHTYPKFIASDNVNTQEFIQKALQNKDDTLVFNDNITRDKNSLRKSSLEDAGVDMKTCIDAVEFKGTHESSFTQIIKIFRNELHIV